MTSWSGDSRLIQASSRSRNPSRTHGWWSSPMPEPGADLILRVHADRILSAAAGILQPRGDGLRVKKSVIVVVRAGRAEEIPHPGGFDPNPFPRPSLPVGDEPR